MEFTSNAAQYGWYLAIATLIMAVTQDLNWILAFVIVGSLLFLYRYENNTLPEIIVERHVKGKNFKEGDHIDVRLVITNSSDVEFRGEIVDILPDYSAVWEGSNINLMIIPPHQQREMIYQVLFERRGKYTIGPVKFRHHTPSLTREKHFEIDSLKEVMIIPQPQKITRYNLPTTLLTSLGGLFRSKLVGDGMDFSGVREYRLGDPMRRVNWKATAKHNTLYSNEFEVNRSTTVIIVLDLTEESFELADTSVRAALGLAEFLMNSRTRVGIITLGEFILHIPVRGGRRHLMEITQHMTMVSSVNNIREIELFEQRLDKTIERIKETNNEVLLFSSLNRPENARILTEKLPKLGRLSVFAPTAFIVPRKVDIKIEMAIEILKLRKMVMKTNLAEKGIKVYEWTPELPFDVSMGSWVMER